MKKYRATNDVLLRNLPCRGKMIIDVGCGNGDTVRWLAGQGARVTGLDCPEMLARARSVAAFGTEQYVEGRAEKLPFSDGSADAILFQASFHHVPAAAMGDAALECRRALGGGGHAVFVEPVYSAGSYTEITRLVEDEEEIQKKAYDAIGTLARSGLAMRKEEFFYLERSFVDYERLLEFFVADPARREPILAQARKITEHFCAKAAYGFADFRYRSICRLNILSKAIHDGAAQQGEMK
jgi:SAM-dependent methyltransferase